MSCCGSHVPAWPSLEAALGKPYLSHKAGRGPLAQWRLSGVLPLRQESFNHTQDSGLLVGTSLYWQLPSQSRPTVDLLPLLCFYPELSVILHSWQLFDRAGPRRTVRARRPFEPL